MTYDCIPHQARDEIVGAGGIRPLVLALDDDHHQTKRLALTALALAPHAAPWPTRPSVIAADDHV